jgi:prepilin-type N-terminal cleavage/methylation domain-containing protein
MVTPFKRIRSFVGQDSREHGFTMVELLVTCLLLVIVLGAIYGIWFGLQRTYGFADEDMTAQTEARKALNEMVEFIRTAREPEAAVAEALDLVIVRAEPNLLIVWADVDRDANHDLELVRFRVDQTARSLFRDDSQTGDITFATGTTSRLVGTWVSNGSNPADWLFSYVGVNGAALTMTAGSETDPKHVVDTTQIREVHIKLKVDVITDKSPMYHELSSVVQPRNLRGY